MQPTTCDDCGTAAVGTVDLGPFKIAVCEQHAQRLEAEGSWSVERFERTDIEHPMVPGFGDRT